MVASTSSTAIGASLTMCCAAAIASWKLPKWQAPTARLPNTGDQLDLNRGREGERALRAHEDMREVDVVAPRHQRVEVVAADPTQDRRHVRRDLVGLAVAARTDRAQDGNQRRLRGTSYMPRSTVRNTCVAGVGKERVDRLDVLARVAVAQRAPAA